MAVPVIAIAVVFALGKSYALDRMADTVEDYIDKAIYAAKISRTTTSGLHTVEDAGIFIEEQRKKLKRYQEYRQMLQENLNRLFLTPGGWTKEDQTIIETQINQNENDIEKIESEIKSAEKKLSGLKWDPNEVDEKLKPLLTSVKTQIKNMVTMAEKKIKTSEKYIKDIAAKLGVTIQPIKISSDEDFVPKIGPIKIAHHGLYIDDLQPNERLIKGLVGERILSIEQNKAFEKRMQRNGNGNTYVTNNIINPIDSAAFRQKLSHSNNSSVIKGHNASNYKQKGSIY